MHGVTLSLTETLMSERSREGDSTERPCLFCGEPVPGEAAGDRGRFNYSCPHCQLRYVAGDMAARSVAELSDEERQTRAAYVRKENERGHTPRLV
jgi:hypothetical protein